MRDGWPAAIDVSLNQWPAGMWKVGTGHFKFRSYASIHRVRVNKDRSKYNISHHKVARFVHIKADLQVFWWCGSTHGRIYPDQRLLEQR